MNSINKFLDSLNDSGLEGYGFFYSIYRAIVTDNNDPLFLNRVRVTIPDVYGEDLWALPFNQQGSQLSGFKYLTPEVGDIVYVQFEFGDPSKPLWSYHSWAENQIPGELADPRSMGIVTPNGNVIVLKDDEDTLDIFIQGKANIYAKDMVSVKSDSIISLHSPKVIINEGDNQGVINILELTEKLNKLIQELENLRSSFNSHTHTVPGILPGPSTTTSMNPLIPVNNPFTQFNQSDYEDLKCLH